MTSEGDPIRVFAEDGKWLVDYGSYANGYHSTRSEAIEIATSAARREKRELVIEVAAVAALDVAPPDPFVTRAP